MLTRFLTKPHFICLTTLWMLGGLVIGVAQAETKPGVNHFAKYDPQVDALLTQMTLAEKIGQMTQADLSGIKDFSIISKLALGSVLSGGNSNPADGNGVTAWTDTYDACQSETEQTRLKIPLLYGVDAVHGHNNVLGAVVYPHNIGLGCTNDAKLVEQIGRMTALDVRATGIQWAFAPCVTVPQDDRWGRTYEGYSEDPQRVEKLGVALVRGLQGSDLASPTSVLACAKHFVGDGGTTAVPVPADAKGPKVKLDQGITVCDEATMRSLHLSPYLPCLEQGVGSIMVSYSSWNGVKCSIRKDLLTDLLKDQLGFEGFLISDWAAIGQCHPDYKEAVCLSINAGMDMAMEPSDYQKFITTLTELVEEGRVPMARIDDAVRRILRVKAAMGLLDTSRNQLADRSLHDHVGSKASRELAREAVQKSVVVLKNSGDLLPLAAKPGVHVHVVGQAADDLGTQCGGWTIDWQGTTGDVTPGGTTLMEGLRQVAGENATITYSATGEANDAADLVIVAVGEPPYAEGFGDSATLSLDAAQQKLIDRAASWGKPVCLVVYSGRPVILSESALKSEAIVAAWLPGTEGAGVADVLLGKAPATGTLSFTWPKTVEQEPLNLGDRPYDCLYPLGHGLATQSK